MSLPSATSPFLAVSPADWLCANDLAFALYDGFPVSPGHVLVTTRRLVETWFDASPAEQAALMSLVNEVKTRLDALLSPQPDGYNVGFNSGAAAGQTGPARPHPCDPAVSRRHGRVCRPLLFRLGLANRSCRCFAPRI